MHNNSEKITTTTIAQHNNTIANAASRNDNNKRNTRWYISLKKAIAMPFNKPICSRCLLLQQHKQQTTTLAATKPNIVGTAAADATGQARATTCCK